MMRKISSLFKRDYEGTRQVYDEVVPGSEWVLDGEGEASLKFDGTACMVKGGKFYKRYDCKQGKNPPRGFIPAQDPDTKTGHWPGWVEVSPTAPEDKWHRAAFEGYQEGLGREGMGEGDGTYELIGPKVQGNPHGLRSYYLFKHGCISYEAPFPPRDFQGLKEWFAVNEVEGIVWKHPDGRMVKIKRRDFGFDWPAGSD